MIQKRNSCFETNSSSSHSVCISMDSEIDPSIYELIKNDKLYIYPRSEGFSNYKTNKCLDKLQFLVSIICTDVSTVHGSKRVKHLRTLLKNAIGVNNVYIGHIDEYYEMLRKRNKQPFENKFEYESFIFKNFRLPKIISDNIKTIEEEIFETRETLRSFILSPNSWLYSLDEEVYHSESDYKFMSEMYCGVDCSDSIATVEYSDKLKVDVEVNLFNNGNPFLNLCNRIGEIPGNIVIDSDKLVWDPPYKTLVMFVGDRYHLISIIPKNCGEFEKFDGISLGEPFLIYRKTNYKIQRFNGVPEYAKSYKSWPIIISSKEVLGDLVL